MNSNHIFFNNSNNNNTNEETDARMFRIYQQSILHAETKIQLLNTRLKKIEKLKLEDLKKISDELKMFKQQKMYYLEQIQKLPCPPAVLEPTTHDRSKGIAPE